MKRVNFAKYGIKRDPQKDFLDDGNRFRFYNYKGLPISYLKDGEDYYLDLRLDYLGIYLTLENSKTINILNKYNGCKEINMEELIEDCEYIIKNYNIKEN